jgi:hypothetical protein
MCHVKTEENIETEGTSTGDTSEVRYFVKDTDVGEHRLMYAPISLPQIECHTADTTFLFSREKYRGAKLRDSEVD